MALPSMLKAMPPKSKDKDKRIILVRWIEDETVGVMPLSALRKGEQAYVGAVVQVKWNGWKF